MSTKSQYIDWLINRIARLIDGSIDGFFDNKDRSEFLRTGFGTHELIDGWIYS
jgi:hypothetical protein